MNTTVASHPNLNKRPDALTLFPPSPTENLKLAYGEEVLHTFRACPFILENSLFFPKWNPNQDDVGYYLHLTNHRVIFVANTMTSSQRAMYEGFYLAATITASLLAPGTSLAPAKMQKMRMVEADRKRKNFSFSIKHEDLGSMHLIKNGGQQLVNFGVSEHAELGVFQIQDNSSLIWSGDYGHDFIRIATAIRDARRRATGSES